MRSEKENVFLNIKLQEIFENLLLNIGFEETKVALLWSGLVKIYSVKSRYYHNFTHLEEMISLYQIYKSNLKFPDEVLYSIFYHDCIYKVTKKDNELKSADYALSILPLDTKLNKELVFDMILATQHHKHNDIEDINWLIDFDLKIVSKDWEDYKTYYKQIRKEYKIYPNFLYKSGRKKVLEHFLEHDFIYQTEIFRNQFENKARINIKKEIELL